MNADQVSHNLWVGGLPTDAKAVDKHFDALVLAAREFQDIFPVHKYPGTKLLLAPLDDDKLTSQDKATALSTAIKVHELMQKDKRVLVACAAGVNRSSLIAGLAMILGGDSAQEAITKIRAQRKPPTGSTPLFNTHFTKFMRETDQSVSPRKSQIH